MKTSKTIALIGLLAGFILIVVGIVISGFEFSKLNSGGAYETKTYQTDELVYALVIEATNAEISVQNSPDESFSVSYEENKQYTYTTEFSNGTFTLKANQDKWYHHIFSFGFYQPKIILYLPESAYDSVRLVSKNGSIYSDKALSVTSFHAETNNGKIEISHATVATNATLESNNGKIVAKALSAQQISLETDNGAIEVEALSADKMSFETDNGSITGNLTGKREDYSIRSKTSNGKNNLSDSSGGSKILNVKTSNGSINITFLD